MRIFPALLFAGLISLSTTLHAQSPLSDISVLSANVQDAVVPALSADGVAFRDYRSNSYGIYRIDLQSGEESLLTTVFFADPLVAHSRNRVAWIGYPTATRADVYSFDLTTNQVTRVTNTAAYQSHPAMHGNLLAWTDYRDAGSSGINSHIYFHNFQTGSSDPITTTSAHRDFARIWGNRVVWQDYRHAGSTLATAEIYMNDLGTGVEHRITNGNAYRANPWIWEHLIVWEDYRNGVDGDIYLFDLNTNTEQSISTGAGHRGQPAIFGEWVVWIDYRNSPDHGDLYGYNLATGIEHALLIHPAHQEPPQIYEDILVWQDYRNGRLDLYRGTLETTTTSNESEIPASDRQLTAFPNPFSGSVQLDVPPSVGNVLELVVYDVIGREARRLAVPSGGGTVLWDGADAAGKAVPGGTYFVVLRTGVQRSQLQLVRVP